MKHILCGNPNTGKTTFLNSLTGSNEHVGNWHGVTVDSLEKKYKLNNCENTIVDLPGLYSLTSFSFEEEVARDYIYSSSNEIINLLDCNNLGRNLYLTLQLLESGKKLKVCLNMANELKKTNTEIHIKKLEKMLGTRVVLLNAQKKDEVVKLIDNDFKNTFSINYYNKLPLKEIKDIIKNNIKNLSNLDLNIDYICVKVLEEDEYIINKLQLNEYQLNILKNYNLKEEIISLRYKCIDEILKECQNKPSNKIYGYSKLDKIILNKFLALPIFLLIILSIFYLTFSSVGPLLSNFLNLILDKCINAPIINLLNNITSSAFIISFVEDGLLSVLNTLVGFLPQIVLLFLFLSILEDTGYMSRLAFTFEDIFSKVGLNGKTVFTLLMGFGCSTTAALTSRTLEDKNSKIKATMLSSYMSCSAKIPLYSVILGAFFNNNIFIILFLYFLGVLIALITSVILEKTVLKSKNVSFIMEMPAYRFPSFKRIMKIILNNIKEFIIRVGSVIFTFSIIIWVLQSFTINLKFITDNSSQTSILEFISRLIAPIFKPLGFGTTGAVSCLICGVVAKEIIISTMAIINNVSIDGGIETLSKSLLNINNPINFTPISAFSYLIFSLLYMPCIATIGLYFKELGKKWAMLAIFIQFVSSYLVTFVFYRLLLLFNGLNFISIFLSLLILTLIVFAVVFVIKFIKKPKFCCLNCKNCNKKTCNNKS
ncbi:MAG: ferrous iron transport protein B [Clostridiales bacterium]|nr:ferrous iron transport protein B [Clostridiales bacterium]